MGNAEKIHAEAKATVQFHISNIEALIKEAHQTLVLTLGASFASLGYFVSSVSKQHSELGVAFGVGAISIHLFIISALIVNKCLGAQPMMPATNEPRNLSSEGFSWEQILEVENENLQYAIDFNRARSANTGLWLNRLRYATFLAPITFLVVLLVASV